MGIAPDQLADRYPVLYHMAAQGSWPSIRLHGLLSTSALLDLFEVVGEERRAIESCHRPESVEVQHGEHGRAIVRDQKPMSISGLERALQDELSPTDWFRILNNKVFFWLTRDRLNRMMEARAYRDSPKTILEVETQALLDRHSDRVLLAPMNTGATHRFPWPRGKGTFQALADYPFEERRLRRLEPAVELAVQTGVPDLADFAIRVIEVVPGEADTVLWQRP